MPAARSSSTAPRGLAGRRRRPRRAADPGDGRADAAGLRAGHRRPDAPGAVAGAAPHARSARPSASALVEQPLMTERARRPGAGKRGRHRAGAAPGRGRRRQRTRAPTRTKRVMRRVLTPIAKFWICKRGSRLRAGGDGMPGRQRLRRGGRRGRDGAHLPRDAAELDLGRRRQHHGAGPAARAAQAATWPPRWRASWRPRAARMPRFDRAGRGAACSASTAPPTRPRPAGWRATSRCWCRPRCCADMRPTTVVRRLLRVAPGRRRAADVICGLLPAAHAVRLRGTAGRGRRLRLA